MVGCELGVSSGTSFARLDCWASISACTSSWMISRKPVSEPEFNGLCAAGGWVVLVLLAEATVADI